MYKYILYHIILYCIVLYCVVLCCIMLYNILLYDIKLTYIMSLIKLYYCVVLHVSIHFSITTYIYIHTYT